jgi:hypothetical protein
LISTSHYFFLYELCLFHLLLCGVGGLAVLPLLVGLQGGALLLFVQALVDHL